MTYSPEDNDYSWKAAKELIKYLGDISTLYFDAIRAINQHKEIINQHKPTSEWPTSLQPCLFVFKVSPTLKAVLYFAAKELYSDEILIFEKPTLFDLLTLFTADEISTILATTFVYRRVQKHIDPGEWGRLVSKIHMHMKIGAIVGDSLEEVGRGNGILINGIAVLSHALFAAHDLKTFQNVRRDLDRKSEMFDTKREEKEWGCNHLQVAALIAQKLGFNMPNSFAGASISLRADYSDGSTIVESTGKIINYWQAVMEITESLHKQKKIIYKLKNTENLFDPEQETMIISMTDTLMEEGLGLDWFTKTKDEVPYEIES
jgi:hypothetical protein